MTAPLPSVRLKELLGWYRWKWLRAWKSVVSRRAGDAATREGYRQSFNKRRFWWQRPLPPNTVSER